jgi:hypothetical protein
VWHRSNEHYGSMEGVEFIDHHHHHYHHQWLCSPCKDGPWPPHILRFRNLIKTRQDFFGQMISPSQKPLPTQDNTTYKHKRQTSMPSAGFEPAIPATKRPQIYALDRAAAGIGGIYRPIAIKCSWKMLVYSQAHSVCVIDKCWLVILKIIIRLQAM